MTTTNRIALVTGANKGIGLEIARQLAQAGVSVIIGARDAERGEAAVKDLASQGLNATFVRIDLLDEASIVAAATAISDQFGHLDILVNNAGIVDWTDSVPSRAKLQAVRRVFETNFFGTLAVTQSMLPLLRKSTAARIVNLSSTLGSLAGNGDPSSPFYSAQLIGYNASKAALNMLTVQLSEEFRNTSHVVNSVSPGYVKTDLTGGNGLLTPDQAAKTPVQFALLGDDALSGRFVTSDGEIAW
ncbi:MULTISPECIES: SDR family oxidoreductase [Rhodopseudomonas]|uniref:Short-chain dehydrogenase n=1 Tax=Rhodopseudomonas palustris TaxID=1076 RepID=A0A0D7EXT4_RHOPL|nr:MULTISPECIES: SDR family oxidoreductase [Rhodopseudomonas]KIZ45360.1 short-chain dehydrogenase [Rhodopseudomonas palustris]MDF3809356.1 SDR family oxidoreductase [Rhodopseudomonas sp. BAL398]WOK16971.1 SDR family oxidoreductase [Rhodopseudomonas sp. BAL398]